MSGRAGKGGARLRRRGPVRWRGVALAGAALGLAAAGSSVTAQEDPPDPVLDRIYGSCDPCEVALERDSLALGGSGSEVPLSTFSRFVLTPAGDVVIGPGRRDDGLWRLEPGGALTRLGGSGEGPGEFTRISAMVWRPDSLLWVFDRDRMNVLRWPDTTFVDMRRLPLHVLGGTALSSGFTVVSSSARTGAALGEPIHVLDPDGALVRSFGNTFGIEEPVSDAALFARRFGAASANTFWAGYVNRYRLELWSVTGELLRELDVERPWFEPWGARPARTGGPAGRPDPFLSVVHRSGDVLWVCVLVPRRGWTPATGPFGYNFDTMLEALDPADGRLLAGVRIQGEVVQVRNDGKLVLRRFDEGGEPVFTFWAPRLAGG